MRSARWSIASVVLVLGGLGCVLDEMDVTGKACDAAHPCPEPYSCLVTAGHGACVLGVADDGGDGGDGGDGADGGDDGGAGCTPDATRCAVDGLAVERCDSEGTGWNSVPCTGGFYCLEPPAGAAACVAPCTSSVDCPSGMYCESANSRCQLMGDCTPLGEVRCNNTFTQLMICDPESHREEVQEDCAGGNGYCDPWAVACKPYCTLDDACEEWPVSSCDPVARRCAGTGVCFVDADCGAGVRCLIEGTAGSAGVCLAAPTAEATDSAAEPSDLTCYAGEPPAPGTAPATCDIEGAVVEFFSRSSTADTIGLVVRAHLQDAVLAGDLESSLQQVTATADGGGKGHYSLSGLPTNTELVLEVQGRVGGEPPPPYGFATLLTFGVYLNADACQASAGLLSLTALAIYQDSYDGYADPAQLADADPDRGVILAQVRDCGGSRVWHAVGGVTQPHDHFFYLEPAPALPNVDLDETTQNGWFGASNVTPIRGLVAAWGLAQDVPISFWLHPVRAFPGKASLVLFDAPDHPRAP